jgi:hypothetical protein
MIQVIPQCWLVAEMPDGTSIQLVVPEPHLEAVLHVLKFNKAKSVSYAWEPTDFKARLGVVSMIR